MRILIATPLYPPETAPTAAYAKELAIRLAALHDVTVLAYAHLPEVHPRVKTIIIEKHRSTLARLLFFIVALHSARHHDMLCLINGASTEMPVLITRLLVRIPYLFCVADQGAERKSMLHPLLQHVFRSTARHARAVLRDIPPLRPEILPFAPYPQDAFTAWEDAWHQHIARITQNHV